MGLITPLYGEALAFLGFAAGAGELHAARGGSMIHETRMQPLPVGANGFGQNVRWYLGANILDCYRKLSLRLIRLGGECGDCIVNRTGLLPP